MLARSSRRCRSQNLIFRLLTLGETTTLTKTNVDRVYLNVSDWLLGDRPAPDEFFSSPLGFPAGCPPVSARFLPPKKYPRKNVYIFQRSPGPHPRRESQRLPR